MALIIIPGRAPLAIGGSSRRGINGVGIESVLIDASKHLIVTLTNGVAHDAGQLPSSDEVDALAQSLSEVSQRVATLEGDDAIAQLAQTISNQGQALADQAAIIADLSQRIAALEQGQPTDPAVPENALTGAGGEPLTGPGGEYLLFVSSPIPENALTGTNDALLNDGSNQILTTGEVA